MPGLFEKPTVAEEELPDEEKAIKEAEEDEQARERARLMSIRLSSVKGLRQLRSTGNTVDLKL